MARVSGGMLRPYDGQPAMGGSTVVEEARPSSGVGQSSPVAVHPKATRRDPSATLGMTATEEGVAEYEPCRVPVDLQSTFTSSPCISMRGGFTRDDGQGGGTLIRQDP